MNQILISFSSYLIILSVSSAFASDPVDKSKKYGKPQIADFETRKRHIVTVLGCSQSTDQYCVAIERADSLDNLMIAVSAKKQNDDKRTSDRLNVLECCLGIDTKNTCESLSPAAKKDLDSCKKKVK